MPLFTHRYGLVLDLEKPLSDLELELYCFASENKNEGEKLQKWQHFRNITEMLWGPKSRKPFIWHPWAERMLDALCSEQYLAVLGGASAGKCLAPDTEVLMFDGSIKKAKDIVSGDLLMGDDSTPRKVLSTNAGRSDMFRIIQDRGGSWECNGDHILVLKRTWAKSKGWRRVGETTEISVRDYIAKSNTFKKQHRLFVNPIEFESQSVEFDPRAYGIWIGDGSTGRPIITLGGSKAKAVKYLTDYFGSIGYKTTVYAYRDRCPGFSFSPCSPRNQSNPFLNFVRKSTVDGAKRIRREYLINSRDVRLELLAGLIDSDGTSSGTHYCISTKWEALADDICFLAGSLGFSWSKNYKRSSCNGKFFDSWNVNIIGDVEKIPTLQKQCTKKKRLNKSGCIGFRVEPIQEGDWNGFTLDGNGRFVLGNFTITHNTDMAAVWSIVNWLASPAITKVMVTSTSLKESQKRIWGSIREYFLAVPGLPGKLVDSRGIIKTVLDDGSLGSDKSGIELISGEKKKEKEAIGKMIGIKNLRMFFIADEMPELSPALLGAFESNLTSNPVNQFVGIGNFASSYDALGEFAEPVQGYENITPDMDEWETKHGKCIRFDGLKSPNILRGNDEWPFIFNNKMLAQMRKTMGENSPLFWRMCRSFPCPESVEWVIYTEADMLKGRVHEKPIWLGPRTPIAFLDMAFTSEGDRSVAALGYCGMTTAGQTVIALHRMVELTVDLRLTDVPENHQIAKQYIQLCKEHGVRPHNAGYDSTSGGGIVFGEIIDLFWSNKCYGLNFGGAASDERVSLSDDRTARQYCRNRVTEIWYSGLAYMRNGQIKGLDNTTARELKSRQIDQEKSKGTRDSVESKRKMKGRVGFSPDYADAFLGMVMVARDRLRFLPGSPVEVVNGQIFDRRPDPNKALAQVYESMDYSEQNLLSYLDHAQV